MRLFPVAFLLSSVCALIFYPASNSSLFTFSGRFLANRTSGGVVFDLEGTALLFGVSNASFIGLSISSNVDGGARLGVYFDSEGAATTRGDPNPA